jgi:4-amino-4-deoxychorismate lyase
VDQDGTIVTTTSHMPPLRSDPLSASFFNPSTDSASLFAPVQGIIIDVEPTPVSLFTVTKNTKRDVYDTARERAGLMSYTEPKDVLLYNEEQLITETSICNIALWRKRRHAWHWITPHRSTGCLPGVTRRWLLEQDRIREASPQDDLSLESVQPGDWVLLFNGVKGCQLGRVKAL